MAKRWEPATVKAQLRLTSLRLGQLQESKDSRGAIARRDIATLLQQRNISAARAKVQELIREDALGDLLEILEMHLGFLLEHLNEMDASASVSPNVKEAASAIIFGACHVDSKDLKTVKDLLTERLGEEFARAATSNDKNHVPSTIVKAVTASASASAINASLKKIASDYSLNWSPEPQRQELSEILFESLDPQASPIVDLAGLRALCHRGLPDEPRWLRPRIWKLLLGTLPVLKASWKSEIQKQRESYYNLLRRLLDPLSHLPRPSEPLAHIDAVLLNVHRQLASVPSALTAGLKEPRSSVDCPLDGRLASEARVAAAQNLDIRLKDLQLENPLCFSPLPHIKLDGTPELLLSSCDPEVSSATPIHRDFCNAGALHGQHWSALLRLLYLHAHVNPGNTSPHIPSLLVLLYTVLSEEIELEDLAHVEADTFWTFEAMVGEFSELEDEDGGNVWMKNFSERLAWADAELSNNLQAKGLDPALPHYSYQWLGPLLTRTLSVSSVVVVWDVLLSHPMRQRSKNHKLDCLVDICTAMLIRAKAPLFSLGRKGRISPSLWSKDDNAIAEPTPLPAWELGDAFLEGVFLLQHYPLEVAGGIDRILQVASDLSHRREEEKRRTQDDPPSLGARLKVTMWKGFTNQPTSPDLSPDVSDEENEKPLEDSLGDGIDNGAVLRPLGLTSRLATSVWRGITNPSAIEVPSPLASPVPAMSPSHRLSEKKQVSSLQSPSGLWGYAEKLKDSDAVATMAKVSSNWRAQALLGSWGPSALTSPEAGPSVSPSVRKGSLVERKPNVEERRNGSWSSSDINDYSLPPRPAYFRPPRDSFILQGGQMSSASSMEQLAQHETGLMDSIQSSLASLTGGKTSVSSVKSVPRPLLLSSVTTVTSPPSRPMPRVSETPTSDHGEWTDVLRTKAHSIHGFQSSVSSLTPSDALRIRYDRSKGWDSDTASASRRVPLNRRSVSPMVPGFSMHQARPMSGSSTTSSGGLSSPPPRNFTNDSKGWSPLYAYDSSPLGPSSSPMLSESMHPLSDGIANIKNEAYTVGETWKSKKLRHLPSLRTPGRVSTSPLNKSSSRSPRLRSKRHNFRPPTLDIPDMDVTQQRPVIERKISNPNSLDVEWPVDDQDIVTTPRASGFSVDEQCLTSSTPSTSPKGPFGRRSRKVSSEMQRKGLGEGSDDQIRRSSRRQRMRRSSNDDQDSRTRHSSAEEGDDEGYNDLLSAYGSEIETE